MTDSTTYTAGADDTTDEQTYFPLNAAQNEGLWRQAEQLAESARLATLQTRTGAMRERVRKALESPPIG